MPSIWSLRLAIHPSKVELHHLHAVVARWLDAEVEHHAPVKPFAICPPELAGASDTTVTIRLLSDDRARVDRMLSAIDRARSTGVRLGGNHADILATASPTGSGWVSLRESASWAELADRAEPLAEHTLDMLSPTYVRTGNVTLPFPMPGSVMRSLAAKWEVFAPASAPTVRFDDAAMRIDGFAGETYAVQLGPKRHVGFVGWARYALDTRSAQVRRDVHRLMLAAPFTGVGSSTTYGFGTVELR